MKKEVKFALLVIITTLVVMKYKPIFFLNQLCYLSLVFPINSKGEKVSLFVHIYISNIIKSWIILNVFALDIQSSFQNHSGITCF